MRDGYWHRSKLLARLCGTRSYLPPIVSTGSRMLITYKTAENSVPQTGFVAGYEGGDILSCYPYPPPLLSQIKTSAVCGGRLLTESGKLESPNYPGDYQPNKECTWQIEVPLGFQVALKFQSFEIENHDNCVYDYIEIRDGPDAQSALIGTYCGYKMPEDIKSTTSQLYVKFVSDGSVQKAGFAATFMKGWFKLSS